jgi:hypothetical protein
MTIGSVRARTGPDCIACGGGIPSHVQFPARTSRGNDMCTSAPTSIPFETNAKITRKLTLSTKVKRLVAAGRYDDYSPDILSERCKTGKYERTGGFQRSHRKCLLASDGPPQNIFGIRPFEKDFAESRASGEYPFAPSATINEPAATKLRVSRPRRSGKASRQISRASDC